MSNGDLIEEIDVELDILDDGKLVILRLSKPYTETATDEMLDEIETWVSTIRKALKDKEHLAFDN